MKFNEWWEKEKDGLREEDLPREGYAAKAWWAAVESIIKKIEHELDSHASENGYHEPDTNAFIFNSSDAASYSEGLQAAIDAIDTTGVT